MEPAWNKRRKAVSTAAIAVVVVVVVAVAGIAAYVVLTKGGSPPSGPSTVTSSSHSVSSVGVSMPSGASTPPSNWNSSHIVSNLFFSPDVIVVVIGVNNTVVWTNEDSVQHTVYSTSVPSGASGFKSNIISQGGTFSVTFQTPGVYKYYCTLHPWMGGEVIVKSG
ncbi:MAG: cupredoxin domain-containing protein [Thaumarchaeota archaeon]|nr:cupredoxin domain-containing protein [Nitrososphaerota archaeon]